MLLISHQGQDSLKLEYSAGMLISECCVCPVYMGTDMVVVLSNERNCMISIVNKVVIAGGHQNALKPRCSTNDLLI